MCDGTDDKGLTGTQVVDQMRRIYNDINDVDLFIGGVSERLVQGAMLGPTFLCLIGDQMARLRRGDRLFYEEATAQFTQRESCIISCNWTCEWYATMSDWWTEQLASLRSVSLARVLCDNGDDMMSIQANAFLRSDVQ